MVLSVRALLVCSFAALAIACGGAQTDTASNVRTDTEPDGGDHSNPGSACPCPLPLMARIVFDVDAGAAAPVACSVALSRPPPPYMFDPEKVNVGVTTSRGSEPIQHEEGFRPCESDTPALTWHYDNAGAPTRIEFCRDACDTLEQQANGVVEVTFGCDVPLCVPP